MMTILKLMGVIFLADFLTGLVKRTTHHGQHHRKPNNSHYCIITNALNPILDKMHFWRGLEYLFGSKAKLQYHVPLKKRNVS